MIHWHCPMVEETCMSTLAQSVRRAAERDGQKIAVEIKSFLGSSPVRDLEEAVGQYQVYHSVLTEIDPGRVLYLAVPQRVYESLFAERFGQLIRQRLQLRLVVFDEHEERIVAWIP